MRPCPHSAVGVFESAAALRLLPLGEVLEHTFTPCSAAAGRARAHWQTPLMRLCTRAPETTVIDSHSVTRPTGPKGSLSQWRRVRLLQGTWLNGVR